MQTSFVSEFCSVEYLQGEKAVVIAWKKFCRLDDYRRPTMFAARLLNEFHADSLIIDARNGFEDDKADVEWGFSVLLPEMSKSGCSLCVFIVNRVSTIEEEMDMWTAEFKKYFTVMKTTSPQQAFELSRRKTR